MLKLSLVFVFLVGCASGSAHHKAEAAKYKTAFELAVQYRDFWFSNFEDCADNNYEEARAEENYQLELILGGEDCGCDEPLP